METLRLEVQGHLADELKICENNSKCISDENTLLGGKVVELGKVTTRRKQISANEDKNNELRELEKNCEQLRKVFSSYLLSTTQSFHYFRRLITKH